MTIRELKVAGTKKLKRTSKKDAALEAEIILAHALRLRREDMLAHDDRAVPARLAAKYSQMIERRRKHEPVAYITGRKEFFGMQFFVNRHTLVPRPETETLVEAALAQISKIKPSAVIDVGTGSGAIAVSIAAHAPDTAVIAADISQGALKTAKRNAVINGAERIIFVRGNLLAPALKLQLGSGPLVITANLPYLTPAQVKKAMPDVRRYEPKQALEGGKDGLRFYDELFHQIATLFPRTISILCEIDPSQRKSLPKLALRHFPSVRTEIKNDLAGKARVVLVEITI